jgi:hypothetical protein
MSIITVDYRPSYIIFQTSINIIKNDELSRLLNMLDKWKKANKKTKISRFIYFINPNKEYSKQEIYNICTQIGINIISVSNSKHIKNTYYGEIIVLQNNTYTLNPLLVEKYNSIFTNIKK